MPTPATADAPAPWHSSLRHGHAKSPVSKGTLNDSGNSRTGIPADRAQLLRLRKVTPMRGPPALGAHDAARVVTTETERGAGFSQGETTVTIGALADNGSEARGAGDLLGSGELFAILWHALADVLGTAAAAALLRRAAQRAQSDWPELGELAITRGTLEYQYQLPASWRDSAAQPPQALRALARQLWPLLVDLTGSIVVNRLARMPELLSGGIVPQPEAQP